MTRRIFLFAVLLLSGTALVGFAAGQAYAHTLPDGVTVSIKSVKNKLSANDSVLVNLTYTNNAAEEVRLLKYETGLNGQITEDVLSIWFDGKELSYTGIHAKRLAPRDKDYIVLPRGAVVSRTVDLQASYPVEKAGDYRVFWRANLQVEQDIIFKKRFVSQQSVLFTLIQDIPLPQLSSANSLPSTYQFCTTSQVTQVASAVALAEDYARVAHDSLSATPLAQRPSALRYKEWFGVYSSGRWATVQNNFNRIYSAISGQTLRFDCSCPIPDGDTEIFAFVYPNQAYTIYLCDIFWLVQQGGTDSKAGTIIHELSHFNAVASTADKVYGQPSARQLALNNPGDATQNADSHEYFAENTPFLSMPIGPTDPGNPDPPPPPEPEPEPVIPSFLAAIIGFLLGDDKED